MVRGQGDHAGGQRGDAACLIELARTHGIERTLAEVHDAVRSGRDAPRGRSYGLPNLDQKLVLRFSRSEMEQVRAWIESASAQVADRTGAAASAEQAILYLCEVARASAAADSRTERHGTTEPLAQGTAGRDRIVYQRCPDCDRGRVSTREGFVELTPEEIERHEGCAEPIVIDGPTPPAIHGLAPSGREADRLPVLHLVGVSATHGISRKGAQPIEPGRPFERGRLFEQDDRDQSPSPTARAESAIADSAPACDVTELASGLVRLGFPLARATQMIETAVHGLSPETRTEAEILRRALSANPLTGARYVLSSSSIS